MVSWLLLVVNKTFLWYIPTPDNREISREKNLQQNLFKKTRKDYLRSSPL